MIILRFLKLCCHCGVFLRSSVVVADFLNVTSCKKNSNFPEEPLTPSSYTEYPLMNITIQLGFTLFYRPRRPVGRVEVQLYSIFRPRHQKGVRAQRHASAALHPRERPGTHCTGGWMGPRAGLDGGKSRPPTGIRSPDRPARSSVAIPTELPGPLEYNHTSLHAFTISQSTSSRFEFNNEWSQYSAPPPPPSISIMACTGTTLPSFCFYSHIVHTFDIKVDVHI